VRMWPAPWTRRRHCTGPRATRSNARTGPIDLFPSGRWGLGGVRGQEMRQTGGGPPVAFPARVEIEVGRGPVLEQRRPRIPPLAAVHALDVPAAGATRLDEVALLVALGHQMGEGPRVRGVAERTPE